MDREALIEAIRQDLQDGLAVRAYADWLEENGQSARAEFIRLERRLATVWPPRARAPELLQRQRELLERHGDEWFGWLKQRGARWYSTFRGMVAWISISAADFLRHGDEILRGEPVRSVNVEGKDQPLAELAASPLLGRLRRLCLSGVEADGPAEEALASSPYVGNLRELTLGKGGSLEALGAVLRSANFRALEKLSLSYRELGEAGLSGLEQGPLLAQLRELNLTKARLGDAGAIRLTQITAPHLTSLDLGANALSDAAAFAIAQTPNSPALAKLDVGDNAIGWDGLGALATAPERVALRDLDAEINRLRGTRPAVTLTASQTHLTSLRLFCNDLTDADVEAFVGLSWLRGLEDLNLGGNLITDTGAVTLAGAEQLATLTQLDLSQNRIGAAGLRAFASSPLAQRLARLTLYRNPLGDEGAAVLAAAEHLQALQELSLSHAYVRAAGAVALAGSPHLANLRELSLDDNPIGAEGALAVARWPHAALQRCMIDERLLPDAEKAEFKRRFGERRSVLVGVAQTPGGLYNRGKWRAE